MLLHGDFLHISYLLLTILQEDTKLKVQIGSGFQEILVLLHENGSKGNLVAGEKTKKNHTF